MVKAENIIPAGKFKAQCLALLDAVADSGNPVIVTKRGKPVAKLVPIEPISPPPSLEGSIIYEGDIISPLGESWEANA